MIASLARVPSSVSTTLASGVLAPPLACCRRANVEDGARLERAGLRHRQTLVDARVSLGNVVEDYSTSGHLRCA